MKTFMTMIKQLLEQLFRKAEEKQQVTKPTPPRPVPRPPTVDIDWEFIAQLEGFETIGYIPPEEKGSKNKVKSGVTIASGFDLGQHNLNYLQKVGFSGTLLAKLAPYMGLVGESAKKTLENNPLQVTHEEALEINRRVKGDKAKEAAKLYNRDSELNFYNLPSVYQTVVMSVAFQYGDLSRRTPNFWGKVTKGDWRGAEWHLRHFGDKYKTRRNREAKLLRSYLKEKGLYYV